MTLKQKKKASYLWLNSKKNSSNCLNVELSSYSLFVVHNSKLVFLYMKTMLRWYCGMHISVNELFLQTTPLLLYCLKYPL